MKNSGKYLEKAVEEVFKNNALLSFNWMRLPDAHSARNFLSAQPADFLLSNHGTAVFLEVKSQKGKNTRFKKPSQEAALRRWDKAGVKGILLIHFHEIDRIFMVNIANLEPGRPSWILDETNSKEFNSVEEALGGLM